MKHGHAIRNKMSKTYRAWGDMKARCLNKNNSEYHNYGGRGITFTKRWDDFRNFLEDMGIAPEGKSLDRINNNGNYNKSNCRWVTQNVQIKNMRRTRLYEYSGITLCLRDWERRLNLGYGTLWRRLERGLPFYKAVEQPKYWRPVK